jgi:hypothetical protein
MNRLSPLLFASLVLASPLCAQRQQQQPQQEIATSATPTSWEEVNFVTNQAVIVDGFPSLLRMAELLKAHPDYKVTIVGHADQRGSTRLNQSLSERRANAVSQLLQKYGVSAGQITASGQGKTVPEVQGRDQNSLFVNRRVAITVTAPDGSQIGDGSLTRLIEDMNTYLRTQLAKLDTMGTTLTQMQGQLGQLNTSEIKQDTTQIRQDTGAIKQDTTQIRQDTGQLVQRPVPLTSEQTTAIAHEAADYALTQSAIRNRKFSQIGFAGGPNFGGGRIGDYSLEAFGKALIPFGNGKTQDQPGTHALQIDGDWLYSHRDTQRNALNVSGAQDAIFSAGLVNRFGHVQVGTFAQFDYVSLNLNNFLANGTRQFSRGSAFLGGGVLSFNYVMKGGMFGVFGAKGFTDSSTFTNTGTTPLVTPLFPTQYIRYADQAGVNGAGTFRKVQIEGSLAFVKRHRAGADQQPSASLKVSFGPSDTMQFFIEGDSNTTLNGVSAGHRAVIGIQFGNWTRARNYNDTQGVLPIPVPRPHYEVLTR